MKTKIIPHKIRFIVVDSFCGAGGYTEGVEKAVDENGDRIAVVIAGINHNANAIASHARNHPETVHFVEDVRDNTLPDRLLDVVNDAKILYPDALLVFHASLECTHFSHARGGMERDPDSRSLAEFMPAYLKTLNPDMFTVENVREFMDWGPMEPKEGKTKEGYAFSFLVPIMSGKGKNKTIIGFKPHLVPIKKLKGTFFKEWKTGIEDLGYVYGHRLHNTADVGAHTSRTRYFAVFSLNPDMQIWPEQTHAKNPDLLINKNKHLKKWKAIRDCLQLEVKGKSIFRDPPLSEKTYERILEGCFRHVGSGDRSFMTKYFSGDGMNFSLSDPCSTITTKDGFGLIQMEPFVMSYYSGSPENRVKSMNDPAQTITTANRLALVSMEQFCIKYYGAGGHFGMEDPCSTLTTKDRIGLIETHFIDKQYGKSKPSGINEPAACITVNPHLALITAETITKPVIIINKHDCLAVKKLKVFMAHYGISDILMRMLLSQELLVIQGFPEDYVLLGSETDKKKCIGNSVPPIYIKLWYEVFDKGLQMMDQKAA